ncbi:MAG: DUF2284 domain-containing protein [Desulfobacteraceae bacterium]|nr:MAG: DUF2284 domain-containing protein [Desulfobacteraceae bacterium]
MKDPKLKMVMEEAKKAGATELAVLAAESIVAEDDLARKCREPRCENYGLSRSCPPHVAGPAAFRKLLEEYSHAVFFRIDVPSDVLYSSESREIFQLLYEVAAGIERSAVRMGFPAARAFAGGSCKKIFCRDQRECRALTGKGDCRNPAHARPSMSGFGINVAKLFQAAGWTMNIAARDSISKTDHSASVCGLVLIS